MYFICFTHQTILLKYEYYLGMYITLIIIIVRNRIWVHKTMG